VLGLRDVMDEPASLVEEWQAQGRVPGAGDVLRRHLGVRPAGGLRPAARDPRHGRPRAKLSFTGYLRRDASDPEAPLPESAVPEGEFVLVTPGGGGDGEELIDWVISAYERDADLPHKALVVFGPFMPAGRRAAFQARVARDRRLSAITFEARFEPLLERAIGVVAMGGYNTFCEILSFGKPALLVPRTRPRLEQYLRAERAAALGLVRMLADDGARDPARMAAALRELPFGPRLREPQRAHYLGGLERIAELAEPWLAPRRDPDRPRLPACA
jgi:predicted glycosyltransferase